MNRKYRYAIKLYDDYKPKKYICKRAHISRPTLNRYIRIRNSKPDFSFYQKSSNSFNVPKGTTIEMNKKAQQLFNEIGKLYIPEENNGSCPLISKQIATEVSNHNQLLLDIFRNIDSLSELISGIKRAGDDEYEFRHHL